MSEAHKARVQAQFGGSAEAYVQSPGHAGGADLETLVAWGRRRGARAVLDIATGGGHTAVAFGAFTRSVVATDLTEAMLRAARGLAATRGLGGVRFAAADVDALPFKDGSFGVVTCRIAAHHFPALLPPLRQIARVLAPGGSLLVQDILGHDDPDCAAFILDVERRRDPTHVRAFTQREWTAFLRAAGMTVMDETIMEKVRPWDDWTARTRMAPAAKAELEAYVRAAPARCREAFAFQIEHGRIISFTDRMLLLRADRD
ncbi:MAG TPA: class I SAM-dependent methyltransferase [Methylomirabilota bacterium]|nr:class I SAM-dependent methyltransferase [Methylomirabilota bacterium]